MRLAAFAAVAVLAPSLVEARIARPLGRQEKPHRELQAPRLWQDRAGAFALERPDGDRWAFRSGMRGPDGEVVPLIALSQESGAQVVVQSAEGVHDVRMLARMLMENLGGEARVQVEELERVVARGGEAYGFGFSVADEVRGRVAVVRTGERVALVIASWPMGAPPEVVDDVESMIGSLGPVPGAMPPGVF